MMQDSTKKLAVFAIASIVMRCRYVTFKEQINSGYVNLVSIRCMPSAVMHSMFVQTYVSIRREGYG
jgi:hypothetical protein